MAYAGTIAGSEDDSSTVDAVVYAAMRRSMTNVFLDTGIFISFLVSRDRHNRSALTLFGGPKPRLVHLGAGLRGGILVVPSQARREAARRFRSSLTAWTVWCCSIPTPTSGRRRGSCWTVCGGPV